MKEETTVDYDKGFCCDKCKSYVKRYTRNFNSNMAVALIALYKHGAKGFVKVEDLLLRNGYSRCGDFSYLRFYKFIEPQGGKREDGCKRTGYYRLTSQGILFVEGKMTAKSKFMILHNEFQGFAGEDITIKDALGSKFSYSELMAGSETKPVERPASYKKPKTMPSTLKAGGDDLKPQNLF
jgi:hypothetical protein